MPKRMTRKDPIENEIELALSPGSSFATATVFSFAGDLEAGAARIEAAAVNLERARKCYVRAGLVAAWEDAVRQIRPDHYRKTAFMAAFESAAARAAHQARLSFLERAKDRWGVGRGGSRK